MSQCVKCGSSGIFLRTSQKGLCEKCRGEVAARFEAEKGRLKEAMIHARCVKDPRDRALHLRRAMNSVEALHSYERLGCGPVRPSLRGLRVSLSEELELVRTGREERRQPHERRRAPRRPEAVVVQLGNETRALTADTSAGGARVQSPLSRRPGTRLDLVLHLPDGVVATEGIVRWVRSAREEERAQGPVIMGVEFSRPLRRKVAYE